MKKISFVFFGSTQFSKELLLFLVKNKFLPKAIFSIPQEFTISYSNKKVKNINYANLKKIALKYNIPYYEINSVEGKKTKDYNHILQKFNLDLILVIGWYYILPKSSIKITKYGAWGIHASLLPKYAGGAPLTWAIINGEKKTGITFFRFKDGVDDGDIIDQKSFVINYTDTVKDVYKKATMASKKVLIKTLTNIRNVKFTPQDKNKLEYYPQRSPEDGLVNWNLTAENIYNFVRAQTLPYPCAFSKIYNEKVKIFDCNVYDLNNLNYKAGEIVKIRNKVLVATKDKFIEIGEVDVKKKIYRFRDYVNIKNLWGKIFSNKKL